MLLEVVGVNCRLYGTADLLSLWAEVPMVHAMSKASVTVLWSAYEALRPYIVLADLMKTYLPVFLQASLGEVEMQLG